MLALLPMLQGFTATAPRARVQMQQEYLEGPDWAVVAGLTVLAAESLTDRAKGARWGVGSGGQLEFLTDRAKRANKETGATSKFETVSFPSALASDAFSLDGRLLNPSCPLIARMQTDPDVDPIRAAILEMPSAEREAREAAADEVFARATAALANDFHLPPYEAEALALELGEKGESAIREAAARAKGRRLKFM